MNDTILYVAEIRSEASIVAIRQRAKLVAGILGFNAHDQTRLATSISEIVRNALEYASGGRVEFVIARDLFLMSVSDKGRGIPNLTAIMNGEYVSHTGMGMGMIGTKRLMDYFDVKTDSGSGTTVTFGKKLPPASLENMPTLLEHIREKLDASLVGIDYYEVRENNQELLQALNEIQRRQEELNRLNVELEDTNRGVVALLAELEEKAVQVQQASDMKSRFISNISHEFRTPLNTIRGLAGMLMERLDGPLSTEQEKQVMFIHKAADDLMELVNDLLDISKIESGKVSVKPEWIELPQVYGALKGMMKPLQTNPGVNFVIDDLVQFPAMYVDEGKLSQILRNLLSNALKFTEQGEVRLSTELDEQVQRVIFRVSDTGIGIAPENQLLIFEEFVQIPNAIQKRVKGTGLGLPLSRRLAELMGGSLTVESTLGAGSTFILTLPQIYSEGHITVPGIDRILVIDDSDVSRYILKSLIKGTQLMEAENGLDGLAKIDSEQPDVIFLDLAMPDISGFEVLNRLRANPATAHFPVIVFTSKVLTKEDEQHLASRDVVAVVSKDVGDLAEMRVQIADALKKAVEV